MGPPALLGLDREREDRIRLDTIRRCNAFTDFIDIPHSRCVFFLGLGFSVQNFSSRTNENGAGFLHFNGLRYHRVVYADSGGEEQFFSFLPTSIPERLSYHSLPWDYIFPRLWWVLSTQPNPPPPHTNPGQEKNLFGHHLPPALFLNRA